MRVMQAGRYFTYTDTGRMELAVRTGLFHLLVKNKWVLIVGGQKIIYRRSVQIFKTFNLSMQLVGWDSKWMYIEHTFVQNGELCCVLHSKVGMRSKGKLVSPAEAFKATGQDHLVSPNIGNVIQLFEKDSETLSFHSRA
jgi:acyl-CoA thioesterase FadM